MTQRTREEIQKQIFNHYVVERQDTETPFSLEAIQEA